MWLIFMTYYSNSADLLFAYNMVEAHILHTTLRQHNAALMSDQVSVLIDAHGVGVQPQIILQVVFLYLLHTLLPDSAPNKAKGTGNS